MLPVRTTYDFVWHIAVSVQNLVQIGWELAEIRLLCIFQDGGRRHLQFTKSAIMSGLWPLYSPYLSAHQIWCKFVKNWPRICQELAFCALSKLATADAILIFQKVLFWTPDDTYIAYIHCVREKKRPVAFLLLVLHFLIDFHSFCINGNRNKYSMTTCNLLTH